MTGKRTKHYVNNKDFFEALVAYQDHCRNLKEQGKPLPQVPRYIGECIQMICRKLSVKWNFGKYTFLEEMVEDGILHCCAAVDNFNPKASQNPFSYFTTIAWHAFVRRIEMETTQNAIKHLNLEELFVLSEEFYSELGAPQQQTSASKPSAENDGLQRHYDVIRNFEAKLARRKEKARQNSLQKGKTITSKKPVRKK